MKILEQPLVRGILPLHPVLTQPLGEVRHAQFCGKVGTAKMILHPVIALARLGAIEPLYIEQLRRVLQPIVIHRLDYRDARIAIKGRGIGWRPWLGA